jgi:hypothetical protein
MAFNECFNCNVLRSNNGDSSSLIFGGKNEEDAEIFVEDFRTMCVLKGLSEEQSIMCFRLSLVAEAKNWYVNQSFVNDTDLKTRLDMLVERFSPANSGFVAIHELSQIKRKSGEKLIELLDRILRIGRRGKIAESVMIGTAVRVLPKVVGLRLCEMGSKGTIVDWQNYINMFVALNHI